VSLLLALAVLSASAACDKPQSPLDAVEEKSLKPSELVGLYRKIQLYQKRSHQYRLCLQSTYQKTSPELVRSHNASVQEEQEVVKTFRVLMQETKQRYEENS
jgi:hypothetical protein